MTPDFLTPERKKIPFLEKLIRKKMQKSFIVNNNNNNNNKKKIIRAWYLRETLGERTYFSKKTGIFPVKVVKN